MYSRARGTLQTALALKIESGLGLLGKSLKKNAPYYLPQGDEEIVAATFS